MLRMLCVFLLSGVLSGCDSGTSGNGKPTAGSPSNNLAPSAETSTQTPIAPLLPPSASDRPAAPGTGSGLSALPGMQPSKGLNVDNLFSEDIRDPMDRIKRVENVVLDMRRDFNTVLPAIMRLVAVEQDMQNLIGQFQTLTEDDTPGTLASVPVVPAGPDDEEQGAADQTGATQHLPPALSGRDEDSQPPPETASAPDTPPFDGEVLKVQTLPPEALSDPPPVEKTPEPAPVSADVSASGPSVHGIRLGEHPDKTRLVLDLTEKADFHVDLDNDEHLLVVELPDSKWTAPAQGTFADAPIVASYRTETTPDGRGSLLVLTLHGPAEMTKAILIPGGAGGARLAVDLKKGP